jgi:hypothetical protein
VIRGEQVDIAVNTPNEVDAHLNDLLGGNIGVANVCSLDMAACTAPLTRRRIIEDVPLARVAKDAARSAEPTLPFRLGWESSTNKDVWPGIRSFPRLAAKS